MGVSHQGVYVQTPRLGVASIVPATASAKVDLIAAGADGTKVVAITVTSTDSAIRVLQLTLLRSAVSYLLATISVPALTGTDGVVAVANMMGIFWPSLPIDNDGNRYLHLVSGDKLQVNTTTTLTLAKEIDVACVAGDF